MLATFIKPAASYIDMSKKPSYFNKLVSPSLLARAQNGDLKAHEELFELFSKPVFNLSLRLSNQREISEDALQNTFISVLKGISSYRCNAPFGFWLRSIAVNETLMLMRKQKRLSDGVLSLETEPDSFSELTSEPMSIDFTNSMEQQAYLEKMLAELPSTTRIVLWLKEVEGYSHQEIAEIMKKSESYSKSLLSRALKALRERYVSSH